MLGLRNRLHLRGRDISRCRMLCNRGLRDPIFGPVIPLSRCNNEVVRFLSAAHRGRYHYQSGWRRGFSNFKVVNRLLRLLRGDMVIRRQAAERTRRPGLGFTQVPEGGAAALRVMVMSTFPCPATSPISPSFWVNSTWLTGIPHTTFTVVCVAIS